MSHIRQSESFFLELPVRIGTEIRVMSRQGWALTRPYRGSYLFPTLKPQDTSQMTDDEKKLYSQRWTAREALGRQLDAQMAAAYETALRLLGMAEQGYNANSLAHRHSLMNTMQLLNEHSQNLCYAIEEAHEWADPEYWSKREAFQAQREAEMAKMQPLNPVAVVPRDR